MNIAIIVSTQDPAGMNIKQCLVELDLFVKLDEKFDNHDVFEIKFEKSGIVARLFTTDLESIHCENIDERINSNSSDFCVDKIIFATKHQSEAGVHSLCVHVPGNWGGADVGGKPGMICSSMPNFMKFALLKLKEVSEGTEYSVMQEVTHHGPLIKVPCLFIEIGSNLESWQNKEAGKIIANTIRFILEEPIPAYESVVVLGGGHYSQPAEKLVFRTDYSVGHICPKYGLDNFNSELLDQAINKCDSSVKLVVVDWKGLGEFKQKVKSLLEENGISWERIKRIEKR